MVETHPPAARLMTAMDRAHRLRTTFPPRKDPRARLAAGRLCLGSGIGAIGENPEYRRVKAGDPIRLWPRLGLRGRPRAPEATAKGQETAPPQRRVGPPRWGPLAGPQALRV